MVDPSAENSGEAPAEMKVGRKVLEVLRISYSLPFVLSSVTGIVFALTFVQDWILALLIPLDVFFLALFVNLSNDYYDHRSGVDEFRFKLRDPDFIAGAREILPESFYWSGNAFDDGVIGAKEGRRLMMVLAFVGVLIALPIIFYGGLIVIVMGVIAFFLSFFYTAPPLNLGERGLGELDVGISFFLIAFFSYFVVHPHLNTEMFLIALSIGIAVATMRVVDEMTGYEAHVRMGEKNLCVRLGLQNSIALVTVLLVTIYVLLSVLLFYNISYALAFLTLPLSYRTLCYLNNEDDQFRFVRSAPEIFKVSIGYMVLIIIALTAQISLTFV